MKEFINNIIPNLKNASEKLNVEAILKNQQWVLVNEDGITTTTYIFRPNKELLVSVNGQVTAGTWEYISKDKLLIKIDNQMLLYRNQFVDDKLLALKKDGDAGFSVFLNEQVIDEFLSNTTQIESHLNMIYHINSNETENNYVKDLNNVEYTNTNILPTIVITTVIGLIIIFLIFFMTNEI